MKEEQTPAILTEVERTFISEYLKDGDKSRAVKICGYLGNTPAKAGGEFLERPLVAREIGVQYQKLVDKLSFGAEEFHSRLIQECDADVADLFDDAGTLKPIAHWPVAWRRGLVTDIHVEENRDGESRVLKIKMASRDSRLQMLGKHRSVAAFAAEKVEMTHSPIDQLFEELAPTMGPPMCRDENETN